MEKTTTTKRITKAMRFTDLRNILNGETVTYGTTLADAIAFIDNELDLLQKKNSGEHKPTAKQVENESYKEMILNYLSTMSEPVSCGQILKSVPEFAGMEWGTQKISALVRQLMSVGKVERVVEKGRALFKIA